MHLDNIDIKILRENFDDNIIEKLDMDNVSKIYYYLVSQGIDYAKDIFISNVDLFLISFEEFIKKFERLKKELGTDYIDKLGCDCSLIEIMYK